jgi:hypothetical protein
MTRTAFTFAPLMLLLACTAKTPADPTTGVFDGNPPDSGPGSEVWGAEDISCTSNADCITGESCLNDVCQPAQCQGGLAASEAPIGSSFTFFADNEIGVADRGSYDGGYWIDTYSPYAGTTDYDGSTELSATQLVDISGGRFMKGQQRAEYVVAIEGRSSFGFSPGRDVTGDGQIDADDTSWVSLGFQPLALDAGDTDADGLDEVVVVSRNGEISNCHMDTTSCEVWTFSDDEDLTLLDVAAGDIDGDAVAELAILIDVDGDTLIYVLNQDHEGKEQPQSYQKWVDDVTRLDVGDLDGDRVAEIIALKDVDSIPLWGETDELMVFSAVPSGSGDLEMGDLTQIVATETSGLENVEDVEVSDTDADTLAEIYIVDSGGRIAAFDQEGASLYERFNQSLSVNVEPFRLALADVDGDSPQATLVDDAPTLAKGAPVPSAMILMPPYDADHSASPSSSFQGASTSVDESFTDTVSLGMQVDMGIEAEFLDLFGVSVSTQVGWRVRQTFGERHRLSVGARFGMTADPEMYGPYHGAVVLYWGCFDTYTYEISDPNGLVNGLDSENFVLTVPVGGSTSVWSLARYNALAKALGTLPVLEVPYEVGNVEDYPTTPERIDGTPIPDEDMVFDELQWFVAPDVGSIAYRSQLSSGVDTATSWDTSIGTSAGVKAAGVKVGAGVEYGWGSGYSLRMGEAAMFSGKVAAVPDDPNTPEDEYNMYTFRFAPVVYRHWYTNPSGDEAPLFVMTYAAER